MAITRAQPFPIGLDNSGHAELSSSRVDEMSGPTASRLEQARALATDKQWDEAINIYCELIDGNNGEVVPLDEARFVSLLTYCHMQIARLPSEALAIYRRQLDPLAQQLLHDGLADREERTLQRIVDEFYCSSAGDDALLALGEIALERGDYSAARHWWRQISPQLLSPGGLPAWLALHDVDVAAHGPEVERRWRDRAEPPDWLAYPASGMDLAAVRARLVLASIRAGELDRAALELELFRQFHPKAEGRLAGQDAPFAATLEQLLTSAGQWNSKPHDANWPTFAGSPARAATAGALGPVLRPAWPAAIKIAPTEISVANSRPVLVGLFGRGLIEEPPQTPERESERLPSCFPIVVEDTVIFADSKVIQAAHLVGGEPALTANGVLTRNEPLAANEFGVRGIESLTNAQGAPRYTLTSLDGIVYGRIGAPTTTNFESAEAAPGDRLVGFDLARDGLLTFSERPPGERWSFEAAPIGDGRRLFVALRRSDVTAHAYVACYDATTGSRLWRTPIGAADTPATGLGNEITHNLLTMVGDCIYFNTNLGLVAALDAVDGDIRWLHRYERSTSAPFGAGLPQPPQFNRDPSPCLFHKGLVVVAPTDSPQVFALDAGTGKRVWSTDELPDATNLLGVVEQNLIVGGNRLAAVDVRSGKLRFRWPESEHAGIRGMGHGVIAGEEVFWPTRNTIYVLHAVTGQQTRSPVDLRSISQQGANLVAACGYLIIAGYDKLTAFAPASNPEP